MGEHYADLPSLSNLQDPNFGLPKSKQTEALQAAVAPHVDSFNAMLAGGIKRAVAHMKPIEFELPSKQRVSLAVEEVNMGIRNILPTSEGIKDPLRLYPAECRMAKTTYCSPLQVRLVVKVNDVTVLNECRVVSKVPIMVKSAACALYKKSPSELVAHGEEAEEMGGYFIINGNEKVLRLIIMPRKNYPICIKRPKWRTRGRNYTEFGVIMNCTRPDMSTMQTMLHFLSDNSATIAIVINKRQYFIPFCMVVKALVNADDYGLYKQILAGFEDDDDLKKCVVVMLRKLSELKIHTQEEALQLLGDKFRIALPDLPPWYKDHEIAQYMLSEYILPHLTDAKDKVNLLIHMLRKLIKFSSGRCAEETSDSPSTQEALLPGHLYTAVLMERVKLWLVAVKYNIIKKIGNSDSKLTLGVINDGIKRAFDIGKALEYLLSTGNLISKTGLGLMQAGGFAVVADKLNFFRYISHFRSIHRGQFFVTMRTSHVRKLLPDAWGFLCPVHTPDGTPCGLLNHLSANCFIVCTSSDRTPLENFLQVNGVVSSDDVLPGDSKNYYEVVANGKYIGMVHDRLVAGLVDNLERCKLGLAGSVKDKKLRISPYTEVAWIRKTDPDVTSPCPGLYIFSDAARMMRSVMNLKYKRPEYIGSLEQVYMDIAVTSDEIKQDADGKQVTTHMEISPNSMLSYLANLTPYSDFNQSPRNMYQCQMGKQTMGTPLHAYNYRSDNKLYRLRTPQSPLVRPRLYDVYNMDEYPLGANAIVAVISYTGYDMEDAFILNRASFERGFGHGSVLKSEVIRLADLVDPVSAPYMAFELKTFKAGEEDQEALITKFIGKDGLPHVGVYLQKNDPIYCYLNKMTGKYVIAKSKYNEPMYVENVKVIGDEKGSPHINAVVLTYRVVRNPVVGDKFASRAGQKGICSQLWPPESMPFTESGMTPDILFNPHGYPSRMTIGMMVETMAGKAAACHGMPFDATPFTFSEQDSAIDYFGKTLVKAGYNYYGTERLYSGESGVEMEADIFIGVVYYQRLRHMVADKFQVRTTGKRDPLTFQPVKGRAQGGGVRFGEMERDGLLSHGASFLTQDRLQICSDLVQSAVCSGCGSLLAPVKQIPEHSTLMSQAPKWTCSVCKTSDAIVFMDIPFSFIYLTNELAAVNIRIKLSIE